MCERLAELAVRRLVSATSAHRQIIVPSSYGQHCCHSSTVSAASERLGMSASVRTRGQGQVRNKRTCLQVVQSGAPAAHMQKCAVDPKPTAKQMTARGRCHSGGTYGCSGCPKSCTCAQLMAHSMSHTPNGSGQRLRWHQPCCSLAVTPLQQTMQPLALSQGVRLGYDSASACPCIAMKTGPLATSSAP